MYDVAIRPGTVIDGSGCPDFRADVGIAGDRMALPLAGRVVSAQSEASAEVRDQAGTIVGGVTLTEMGGVRIYHAGDSVPYEGQVERLRVLRPDVALLPINGRHDLRERLFNIVGNMDARQAVQLARAIGARLLIAMHWELFWLNRGSPRRLLAHASATTPEPAVRV